MRKKQLFLFLFWGFFLETQAQDIPQKPVIFASYNLKNYLITPKKEGDKRRKTSLKPEKERRAITTILKEIHPDILGICEIGQKEALFELQTRLKKEGLCYPYHEWIEAWDKERHLALLSKYPFVAKNSQTTLTYQIDGKKIAFRRGILDVTIKIGADYQLHLVGVHLKSKREIREAHQAHMRRQEAHLLRKHIDAILQKNKETNLLVYGDFNATKNEASISELKGKQGTANSLTALPLQDTWGERWTYYWPLADTYYRYDYLFVSQGLYPEIEHKQSFIGAHAAWNRASDHRPLVLTFTPRESAP